MREFFNALVSRTHAVMSASSSGSTLFFILFSSQCERSSFIIFIPRAEVKEINAQIEKEKTMLPRDGAILLSFINMKLRDGDGGLSALSEDLDVPEEEIVEKLAAFGYHYDEKTNRFI